MGKNLRLGILGGGFFALLIAALACAGAKATPTPAPPPTPRPAVAPTVAPAPTPVTVAKKPNYGGTLRTASDLTLSSMDPSSTTGGLTNPIGFAVYNNLVSLSPNAEVLPELARSWDISADGKAITFRLAQGVKFHDGTALNAQAVKWNFDRLADPNVKTTLPYVTEPIERVEVRDDATLTIQLKRPFRAFLSFLTELPGMVLSPTAVQKTGSYISREGEFGKKPVGSGPFIFKEWVVDSRIVVERNPNYWEAGKPYLDQIIWQVVPDASVRVALARTGELHFIDRLSADDVELLKRSPGVVVDNWGPQGVFAAVAIRVTKPPLDNKVLRHALAYGIDRKKYIDVILKGGADVAWTMIAAGWARNPELKVLDYDLQKARQKVAEAGYPSGVSLGMNCDPSPSAVATCEFFQSMWKDIGVNIKIELYEPGKGWARWVAGENWLSTTGFSPTADPHLNLFNITSCKGGQNKWGYCNPKFDELLTQAGGLFDTSQAKKIYDEAQRIMTEDAPLIFMGWRFVYTAKNNKLQNYAWVPDNDPRLRDLWLEK